jgi:hypothetical protein
MIRFVCCFLVVVVVMRLGLYFLLRQLGSSERKSCLFASLLVEY